MKIYVDIDETICFYSGVRRYELAEPNRENINKINKLYDDGHEIIYWTARGCRSQTDCSELTVNQLTNWRCKYHELICNEKPDYDLLICDKTKRIEEV
jgi:hypothetical protein